MEYFLKFQKDYDAGLIHTLQIVGIFTIIKLYNVHETYKSSSVLSSNAVTVGVGSR